MNGDLAAGGVLDGSTTVCRDSLVPVQPVPNMLLLNAAKLGELALSSDYSDGLVYEFVGHASFIQLQLLLVNNYECLPEGTTKVVISGMDLNERIKKAREFGGFSSQQKLAKKVKTTPQTIQKLESGEQKKTSLLPRIARACGVRIEWLEWGEGPMEAEGVVGASGVRLETEVVQGHIGSDLVEASILQVPIMNAVGSMGRGLYVPEHDVILDYMRLSLEWVRRNLTISQPNALRIVIGYGDSMCPTFNDGDPLLVDTGITDLKIDAVYVLAREDELFIKRVQRRLDGTFVMHSDNSLYEPIPIESPEAARLRVHGRVVWAWNGKRL